MKRFQYEITTHSSDEFRQVVYFCSEKGECGLNEVAGNETAILVEIMNKQGKESWELIQLFFGKDGVMAFWKRELEDE